MSTAGADPIVVGVDDSSASREALVYGAWEAERRGLPLRIVHGYLVPTPCLTPQAPLLDEARLRGSAWERLDQTAQVIRSRRPRLPLTTQVVRAAGGVALVQESARAGLIVVGAPHLRGFATTPIGSVVTQVVAEAHCPVLVVPRPEVVPAPTPSPGPVVVGVDGRLASEPVLGLGFEEASARGVPLVAVHVWSVPELGGLSVPGDGAQWSPDRERAQLQLQETAERTLAEVLAGWQERYPQVTVRRWVVHSFGTARVLLDVVREVGAGLLVVGSRGRGGVSGAVLGSVSQTLISHTAIPVVVIGPRARPRVEAGWGSARSDRE
jgi:nucleotide-binding universal stress UspA family protein